MTSLFRSTRHYIPASVRYATSRFTLDPKYVVPDGRVLSIQQGNDHDLELILKFFKANFSVQEPISRALNITYEELEHAFYRPVFKQALQSGLSTLAFHGDELVAVSTVTVVPAEKKQVDLTLKDLGPMVDENMKKFGIKRVESGCLFTFLNYLETVSLHFLPEGTKKIVRAEAGSVCPTFRGGDVRRKLAIETSKLAAKRGLEIMDTMCSATASTKVMKDLGFKKKFSLVFSDCTYHGKPIFSKPLYDNNDSFNVMHGNIQHIILQPCPKPETIEKYLKPQAQASG
ncbi:unnamed protein product [Bursaphelenchus xylophilus]|uniref:(pine wood nematode) hypothetical protein n=1 Tax=Bursaphelenchus xylophilus TaxID=6326 RepID=A0A7I8XI37_BURXY|nr:unnamed protein product [Bursaphelenchus xylophilus]CAG9079197.1 unnamed protein product [Bursaphelenchus xylophilus]